MQSAFRHLPSVEKVLSDERIKQIAQTYPHNLLLNLVRQHLERIRLSIIDGNACPSFEEIAVALSEQMRSLANPSLRPLINATGVILHTNLGRAPLSQETLAAMSAVARSYCNLEFDLDRGARGSRQTHIEPLLCQLTAAEAALVVNNNASAVLLALTTLAKKKEVIISRGQAVEIGGGFRIPEVMRQSGAKLVEVGTTNASYVADYEAAITPRTSALMRVHASNFRVVGFVHSVTFNELVTLGKSRDLPVFDDIGSGCLLETSQFGLAPEPVVQQSIASGAELVFFSGDKLLGGPQAGIIVGRKALVDRLKKHPLARALRIDKVGLAGLAATLIHYLKGEAVEKIPVWRMIAAPLGEIQRRAERWAEVVGPPARVFGGESVVGGGSLPGSTLPTKLVAMSGKGQNTAQAISQWLKRQPIPVVGRISGDKLLLDPRSVLPEEDELMHQALRNLAATLKRP